jgi:hypothetical protein
VEAVLIRALAKDRSLRYESVDELNLAFQKAVTYALENGNRKTRTPLFDRSTAIYEKYQHMPPSKPLPWYRRRAAAVGAIVLALIACPLSAWGMSALLPGFDGVSAQGAPQVFVVTSTGLEATILALMTANAPRQGTDMAPEQVNKAVVETLAAMGIVFESPTPPPTETLPVTLDVGTPGATPTPTRTLRPGETPPTPTPTVPSKTPTSGPSPTPTGPASSPTAIVTTAVPTVAPSNTQAPTSPPAPTNTPQPPQPTATPVPPGGSECGPDIPPGQCNKIHKTQTAAAATP